MTSGKGVSLVLAIGQMRVHEFKIVIKKLCYNLEPCFPELLKKSSSNDFPLIFLYVSVSLSHTQAYISLMSHFFYQMSLFHLKTTFLYSLLFVRFFMFRDC